MGRVIKELLQRIADGRTDLIYEVIRRGHVATKRDDDGVSLMNWCAYFGDVSGIRYLMAAGASLESLGSNFGLEGAAFHGHWQLCQFLLEEGADPDHRNGDTGETPLHAALCKANRPEYDLVIEVLIGFHADPNIATVPGRETGAFMRDCRTKGETPLHRAAAFGSERAVRMLLDANAKIDARDSNGDSPLSWASWHLRPDAILRLLCFDSHQIHPSRNSTYDHGMGWGVMGTGRPHGGPIRST